MELTKFLYHNYLLFILLAAGILYFTLKETLRLFKLPKCYRLLPILSIVGMLYPLTKVAQFCVIGPSWFRSYGADIGFVPAITFLFVLINLKDMNFKNVLKVVWSISIFSMLYEMFQIRLLHMGHYDLGLVKGLSGRGDIVDLWLFFFTMVISLIVIHQTFRRTQKMWRLNYENLHNNEKRKFAKQYENTFKNLGIETK